MTYKEAQIEAYNSVDASSEALIKTMLANYQKAHMFCRTELDRLYAILAGVKPQDWYNTVIKMDRLQSMLDAFSDNYIQYASIANKQTEALLIKSMKDMYYRTQYIHAAFMPEVISLTVIPEAFVKAAVTGQAEAMKQITEKMLERFKRMDNYIPQYGTLTKLLADRDYEAVASVQQAVTQAILQGQGMPELTENINNCFTTAEWKAARIARTESLRVSSAGQYAYTQDLENEGIDVQKMWVHVMTTAGKSRPSHEHYDGTIVDADKPFVIDGEEAMYPRGFGDPEQDCNCRCTYVNIVNGVSPSTRAATDPETGEKEIFSFKTYDEWAKDKGIDAA